MPLSRPNISEPQANEVTKAMIINCTVKVLGIPNKPSRPELICITPRPKDVTTPNIVPNTAKISTVCPHLP